MTFDVDLDWPAARPAPDPDPRTPLLITLDLDLSRAELTRITADLAGLYAIPNLDPHTRYLLSILDVKIRARARQK